MKKIKGIISILLSFMLMFSGTYIGEISSFADSAKATSKMISIGNFEDEVKVIEKSDGSIELAGIDDDAVWTELQGIMDELAKGA